MAGPAQTPAVEVKPPKHTTWKALIGGLIAYALIKLAGIGIVTGVGPSDVMALPDLFLPAMASRTRPNSPAVTGASSNCPASSRWVMTSQVTMVPMVSPLWS